MLGGGHRNTTARAGTDRSLRREGRALPQIELTLTNFEDFNLDGSSSGF